MCDVALRYRSKCDDQEYFIIIESYDGVNSDYPDIQSTITNYCTGDIISLVTSVQGDPLSINEQAAEIISWETQCDSGLSCLLGNQDLTGAVPIGEQGNPVQINSYAGPFYKLDVCDTGKVYYFDNAPALDFYLDRVISFTLNTEEVLCGTLTNVDCVEGAFEPASNLSIIDYFTDCEECEYIPPVIPEETKVKQRTVKPGYNTPGCPPEYYDKTNCKFGEAQFQEVANRRFGIEFCCDPDQQKWEIKKELLDLAAAKDPDICETISPTPEAACDIVCLNLNQCFPGPNEFSLFITNGNLAYSGIRDYINSYQESNPVAYNDMLLYIECTEAINYCLKGICFYTQECYQEMITGFEGYVQLLANCRKEFVDIKNEDDAEFDQLQADLQTCIQTFENLYAALEKLQQELADAIAAGEPQEVIDKIQAEIDMVQADIDTATQECGTNSIAELQQQLFDAIQVQDIVSNLFEYLSDWNGILQEELQIIIANLEEALPCCTATGGGYNLFPFICDEGEQITVTFTSCNDNQLTVPLGTINKKLYHKAGTVITHSSTSYGNAPFPIVEPINPILTYNELASIIFSWDAECISSDCKDDPNPPDNPGAP